MKNLFESFRNIKLRTLAVAVPVTLAYPAIRAATAEHDRMRIFSDTLLITSLVLILFGVLFSFYKKGDFDIMSYMLRRSAEKNVKPFEEFKKDSDDERRKIFNYPLWLGILYLTVASAIGAAFFFSM